MTCIYRVGDKFAVSSFTLKKAKFFKDQAEALKFALDLAVKQGELSIEWDDRPSIFLTKGEEK